LRTWWRAVISLGLVVSSVSACGLWPADREASTPTPTANDGTLKYMTVTIAEIGLSFDVRIDWQRLEPASAWSPDVAGQSRVEVQWKDIQPPVEMEVAMLPQNAVILEAEPVELSWGQGKRYTVEVYARAAPSSGKETAPQVVAVESHVLIAVASDGSKRVYDFYASARDAEALSALQPELEHMWRSARLAG
jgi:hypothetical protein